jgi:hypothetical protein
MTKDKLPYPVRRWVKRHAIHHAACSLHSLTFPQDVWDWLFDTKTDSIDPDKMNLLTQAVQNYQALQTIFHG